MSSFTTPLSVIITDQTRKGRMIACLQAPFDYYLEKNPHEYIIGVPAGFKTDLASVPRGLWTIWPPLGRYSKAAVVHDFLYKNQGKYSEKSAPLCRKDADAAFLEAMRVSRVGFFTRHILWLAVRIAGGKRWSKE